MRKIIIGLSILSLILTASIAVVEASDDVSWKEKIKEKIEEFRGMTPEERKEQKEEAVVAMEELKNSEEWEEANKEERMEMVKELDVFPLRGFGRAFGSAGFKESESFSGNHQAVIDAIEAEDYGAWLKATENRKVVEEITEENFQKLVEAYKLMKEGKKEESKEIMKELGFNRSPMAIKAFGRGFTRGHQEGRENCNCECSQE